MEPRTRALKIVVDRKAALMLISVVFLVGGAGLLSSQQLTMTATYPIPAGVYNQLVTTGNSGAAPADTTLNRNAGNTILVPPTNAAGGVGIGTTSPVSKLDVAGGIHLGDDTSACTAGKDGTVRWHSGAPQVCQSGDWRALAGAQPAWTDEQVAYSCHWDSFYSNALDRPAVVFAMVGWNPSEMWPRMELDHRLTIGFEGGEVVVPPGHSLNWYSPNGDPCRMVIFAVLQ